jgi:predicted TIM-barrel fold metal-dependent hydrolase
MKIIDAHTHIFPQYIDLAVQVMDRCGIDQTVTLAWHDGFGESLKGLLKVFNRYPGRFIVFGNVDFRRINEPSFARDATEQMERDVEAGMRGLKVYKALGLDYKHEDGSFWRINDPRLDPIWSKAGELGIPIIMHTADPCQFWQPVNTLNFWDGVLYGEYAWWTYYRSGYPSFDELVGERNGVILRHPKTIFIAPHIGSRSESLDYAAEDLEALPNLYYDISARIPIMGLPGRRSRHAREFLIEFQDRILFGTDLIYDDTNVPTGLQAQCLYQPYEIPLGDADPKERYVETSVEFVNSHLEFLQTDHIQEHPPFKRCKKRFSIVGLNLPIEINEKILYHNAKRLIPQG